MEKLLYIIRHGQTDLNKEGIVQGRGIDSPLNKTGWRQADAFYQAYKNVSFDRIYTSRLQRTYQTIEQFVKDGVPHTSLEGLDEISWGIYEGKPHTDEIATGFEALVTRWKSGDLHASVKGGESPAQLIERQRQAIDHILTQENESKVLICMHGRAIRILLSWLICDDPTQMDTFQHTNTALYKVRVAGDQREIVDPFNITHLEGLLK